MTRLRGMTWDHPRGVDPLVACAEEYTAGRDMQIDWDARLLEDFEAFPLDQLAREYDLLVIDHPHVGAAAASGCLVALDTVGREAELAALKGQTVGRSHESYHFAGRQWALAIDAAAQVACCRADWAGPRPRTWDDVIALARTSRVLWPLAPVHALMSFYSLCANAGAPCGASAGEFVDQTVAAEVLTAMRRLADVLPAASFNMNPINVLGRMQSDNLIAYCPLIYGYVTYALSPVERNIAFHDMPGLRDDACNGSTLGGTGIAVSAKSANQAAAIDFAFHVASAGVQKTTYAAAGGQPAHREAWTDDAVNRATGDFYRNTIRTLEGAYVRPRFDGYVTFQHTAGEMVATCLRRHAEIDVTIDRLNHEYRAANPNKEPAP